MAVSKTLRYQVFRRDNHACRYCGRSAPEVKLTIDHVVPEALGGTDEPSNLVTACSDCNSGKSAAPPDAAIVADVEADALRWAGAIRHASAAMLSDLKRRQQDRDRFREAWEAWSIGEGKKRTTIPLPGDWAATVDRFVSLGLPLEVLIDCIAIAMAHKHVKLDKVFSYVCGIAWNKVRQLQEAAAATVKNAPGDADEDWEPCPRCRASSRNEMALELFSRYFTRRSRLFDDAVAAAREELDLEPNERFVADEEDEVVLAAAAFLDRLNRELGTHEYCIEKFLERIPPELKEWGVQEAHSDFYKADDPFPSNEELAPHTLRHIAWKLSGGEG